MHINLTHFSLTSNVCINHETEAEPFKNKILLNYKMALIVRVRPSASAMSVCKIKAKIILKIILYY